MKERKQYYQQHLSESKGEKGGIEERVIDVLRYELEPKVFIDLECIQHLALITSITRVLFDYFFYSLYPLEPPLKHRALSNLDSLEWLFQLAGMKQDYTKKLRKLLNKIDDPFGKIELELRSLNPSLSPVSLSEAPPKQALAYQITKSLREAFPSLSSRRAAVRVTKAILIEFGIERDARVRPIKVKAPKRDPVVNRIERSIDRFIKQHGTPETIYAALIRLYESDEAQTG